MLVDMLQYTQSAVREGHSHPIYVKHAQVISMTQYIVNTECYYNPKAMIVSVMNMCTLV